MRGKLPIIVELHRWRLAFILTFLVIVCARWAGIATWASDTPFADEWDTEGVFLYPKLADGTLSVADFLHPANEHHIVFTHLLNTLLLYVNGQWDPIVQMMASSIIMAFVYAFLAYQVSKQAPPLLAAGCALLCILLGMPLASSGNSLVGYQSQVAFCLLFSVLAMAGWASSPRPLWGLALLATTCAVFSMGPGIFTALVPVFVGVLMAVKGHKIPPPTRVLSSNRHPVTISRNHHTEGRDTWGYRRDFGGAIHGSLRTGARLAQYPDPASLHSCQHTYSHINLPAPALKGAIGPCEYLGHSPDIMGGRRRGRDGVH